MAARILICDNEEPLRSLLRATLDDGRYELTEARDGDESLELARELRPDLIVLDIMMPGRTGLEVLTTIRADAELASTPVIMLTARTQATDIQAAEQAGVDRFVGKPFSPRHLISVVEELLESRP